MLSFYFFNIEYEEMKLDSKSVRFNIVLPKRLASIDLINLKIGENFINYLTDKALWKER